MKIKRLPVAIVENIKVITGLHTYQVEFLFVGIILFSVLILTKGKLVEVLASLAVFFSFAHAKIANRLAEREAYRLKNTPEDKFIISYSHKVKRYFILKEFFWVVYFVSTGAYSALAGCFIFLIYEPWRKLWRKYHSLEEKIK